MFVSTKAVAIFLFGFGCLHVTIAEVDSAEVDAEVFNKWFSSLSPPVNKLQVVPIPGYRLGTRATAPIEDGELYLSVPFKAIMHASKVYDVPVLGDTITKLNKMYNTEDQFHQLLFLLMHEKNNPDSFWKPYLRTLPKSFNNPVYWGPKELSELQGSTMKQQAEEEYSKLSRQADGIQTRVFDKFLDGFPKSGFNRESYMWAHSILDSRAIWMDGQRNLVPMLDMVNCGEGPDPTRVHRSKHAMPDDTAETRATWAFKKEDQVLENYGQPNSIYFKYHGFLVENNSHNCVDMEFNGGTYCVGGKKGLPHDFLGHVQKTKQSRQGAATVKAAVEVVKEKLASYPTSPAEDHALLADPTVDGRKRMAVSFRLDEKKLLQAIIWAHEKDSKWAGEPLRHEEL